MNRNVLEAEKKFIDEISLEDALKKLGGHGFIFMPSIEGNGYGRHLKYYCFRGLLDPFHKCTIFLENLFWHEMDALRKRIIFSECMV